MTKVKCFMVMVSVDGAHWNPVSHHFDRHDAELEAQSSLFTYRRMNPKAKTKVEVHVENLSEDELDDLIKQGMKPQKI